MEVLVRVRETQDGHIKDNTKSGSESGHLKKVADPVVYKLVRVDFDGRLVPATDDELMEVENMLESDKSEIVSDVLENVQHGGMDKYEKDEKPLSEEYKGSSQIKTAEVDKGKLKSHPEGSFSRSTSSLNPEQMSQSQNAAEESGLPDGLDKCGSDGFKPNFSLLKGEVNLDNLSIRELQETFRATFGRETSVKDKMWLKRRIAMGLTHSCDVAVTSFIINDGKLMENEEDFCENMACEDSVVGEVCSIGDDMSVDSLTCPNLRDDTLECVAARDGVTESGSKSDDGVEHRAAKRVRKPTKRYIEELSDKEAKDSSGKINSPSKPIGQDNASLKSAIRPAWSVHSGAFITRPDSIGGSGVEVPYVSRVRRCRPRQSLMAVTDSDPSNMVMNKLDGSSVAVKKSEFDTSTRAKRIEIKTVPFEEPISSEEASEKRCLTSISDSSQDREPKYVDSAGYISRDSAAGINSDDNIATVSTSAGAMKRKHHRAWTLAEVVKLVDGVSKFGAGRWSEIKRLSFSSYAHRTSVDLKDKWRNLLKASFAYSPAEKGVNRKTASFLIPEPILVKVRELAELNGQAPQIHKASGNNSATSVNENR